MLAQNLDRMQVRLRRFHHILPHKLRQHQILCLNNHRSFLRDEKKKKKKKNNNNVAPMCVCVSVNIYPPELRALPCVGSWGQ
mmetsp:Transcript_102182/g.200387  ORF Transcript_102182/g.200387 Transcript_102182/m.200387 type:complete len:82 (+) Transcript_102182:534-779(+)